jgi:hypothetical protein
MAVMNCFADTAGVRGGSCRQGQRDEVSHERQEEEKFGDQLLGDQSFGDQLLHTGSAMLEAYQVSYSESNTRAPLTSFTTLGAAKMFRNTLRR